ncbi:MAG: hypothetical protein P8Y48_08490 [Novosphingobium sp.]
MRQALIVRDDKIAFLALVGIGEIGLRGLLMQAGEQGAALRVWPIMGRALFHKGRPSSPSIPGMVKPSEVMSGTLAIRAPNGPARRNAAASTVSNTIEPSSSWRLSVQL